MPYGHFLTRLRWVIACAVLMFPASARAIEPGVDVAVPRVSISMVDGATIMFHPARIAVEQGDWVRWVRTGGSHTTTSGSNCVADGLWTFGLNLMSPGPFTRQFPEPPGIIPFFCSPHCTLGMVGQVEVSSLIQVSATDSGGSLKLSWSGGSGMYQPFRSDNPAFTGPLTVKLPPDAGATGTTLTDTTQPPLGRAAFYLIMNLF